MTQAVPPSLSSHQQRAGTENRFWWGSVRNRKVCGLTILLHDEVVERSCRRKAQG